MFGETESVRFGELLARAPNIRALFVRARELAEGDRALSLCGEAGSGKQLLARAVHQASGRRAGAFVTFDCAGQAVSMLESELFGRADPGGRAGSLELASGGTLLLREPGELPLPLQHKLLGALRERSFTRVGGSAARPLELRLLSASRRRLAYEVERGRFLAELAALLCMDELALPPLREHREDVPLLATHFLSRLEGGEQVAWSRDALETLAAHDWPGNVRELRNVTERLFYALRSGGSGARRLGSLLLAGELPPAERRPSSPGLAREEFDMERSYREERARFEAAFERQYVAWLLDRFDGNVSAAARSAGMDRKYLDKLARRHALHPRQG